MTTYTCPSCGMVRVTGPRPVHDHDGERVRFVSEKEAAYVAPVEPVEGWSDPFADDEPVVEAVVEPEPAPAPKPVRKRSPRKPKAAS